MHIAQGIDPRIRQGCRRLATLVAARHISRDEALTVLLNVLGNPPVGSQRRLDVAWALADEIAAVTRDQLPPTLGSIVDRIVARMRPSEIWGPYCPIYEPDPIRPPPEPLSNVLPFSRWRPR